MAKQELLASIRDRYRESSRKDKSKILDEFIAVTGHHRKHDDEPFDGFSRDDLRGERTSFATTTQGRAAGSDPKGDSRPNRFCPPKQKPHAQ